MNWLFANPALWAGMLAVGVPLVVHLLSRHRARQHPFPTIRFLQRSVAHKTRIHNLRHWILLLLRTLAVAALAFAFLRPLLVHSARAEERDGQIARLLLLDVSASMAARDDAGTAFQRARRQAAELICDLDAGDVANIILCGAAPEGVFPEPGTNHTSLLEAIETAAVRPERGNMAAAFTQAVNQLARSEAPRREIHFLSDFQESQWRNINFASAPPDISLTFVDVEEQPRENDGILSVATRPAHPVPGETFEVVCTVGHYSGGGAVIPVRVRVNNTDAGMAEVSLQPWSSGTVAVPAECPRDGLAVIECEIPADALEADNLRRLCFLPGARPRVVLLTDENPNDPDSSAFFLTRALAPLGGDSGRFDFERRRGTEAGNAVNARPEVLVVSGVAGLSEEAAVAIAAYVEAGGRLLWFPTAGIEESLHQRFASITGGETLLPAAPRGLLRDAEGIALEDWNSNKPPFRLFKAAETGDLTQPRFHALYAAELDARAEALARFEGGNAAVAFGYFGDGQVLQALWAPTPAATDWVKRPTFLPFLYECLDSLSRDATRRVATVGETGTVRLEEMSGDVLVLGPEGEPVKVSIQAEGAGAVVIVSPVSEPGIYRTRQGGRTVDGFAANVHAEESDLRQLPLANIAGRTQPGAETAVLADPDASAGRAIREMHEGRPVWHWFVLAALCFLGLELWLTTVWRVG